MKSPLLLLLVLFAGCQGLQGSASLPAPAPAIPAPAGDLAEAAHSRIDDLEPWIADNRQRIERLEAARSLPVPATIENLIGRSVAPPGLVIVNLEKFKAQQSQLCDEQVRVWRRRARSRLATDTFIQYAESVAEAYEARARAIRMATTIEEASQAAGYTP